jgi:hypothetical protein
MKEMKKLRITFLIVNTVLMLLIVQDLFCQEYTINTSRGDIQVEVPENATLEEAFKTMSILYLEEKWDHEDLIEESEALLEKVTIYQESVSSIQRDYDSLLQSYSDLNILYKEKAKITFFKPEFILSAGMTLMDEIPFTIGLQLGGELLEKFSIYTELRYPLSIGLSLGVTF